MSKKAKKQDTSLIVSPKQKETALELMKQFRVPFDPDVVFDEVVKEVRQMKLINGGKHSFTPENYIFKAITLSEFDNGILMTEALSEHYKTLSIHMSRELQVEFMCKTVSEKATAELVAVNYCRTLEIQRRINNYLQLGSITDTGVRFLDVLSKELDRANRHYLTAVQALKTMKQSQPRVSIKTDTAIFGRNQLIQENRHK
mgnify:CR=1 FL=1